jgi:hypothetical protein
VRVPSRTPKRKYGDDRHQQDRQVSLTPVDGEVDSETEDHQQESQTDQQGRMPRPRAVGSNRAEDEIASSVCARQHENSREQASQANANR